MSAVAAIAVVAGISVVLLYPLDPWTQPGTTWKRGDLSGETIRLLDNGKYVSRVWCDICETQFSEGTWTEQSNTITLSSKSPRKMPTTFRRIVYKDCELLFPNHVVPAKEAFPVWDTYHHEHSDCYSDL